MNRKVVTDLAGQKKLKAMCGGRCDVPLKFSFWNQRHVDLTAWSTEDRQPSTPTALGMPSTEEGCQIQNYAPSILCPMADRCWYKCLAPRSIPKSFSNKQGTSAVFTGTILELNFLYSLLLPFLLQRMISKVSPNKFPVQFPEKSTCGGWSQKLFEKVSGKYGIWFWFICHWEDSEDSIASTS